MQGWRRKVTWGGSVLLLWIGLLGAAAPPKARTLPDRKLTPGAVLTRDQKTICAPGYAKRVRSVSAATKQQVFRAYKITNPKKGEYAVDHLIPLELGGSNDVKNLWPESETAKPWNSHRKDELENRLHALVCAKKLSLADAQKAIATDWTKAWTRYCGGKAPR